MPQSIYLLGCLGGLGFSYYISEGILVFIHLYDSQNESAIVITCGVTLIIFSIYFSFVSNIKTF